MYPEIMAASPEHARAPASTHRPSHTQKSDIPVFDDHRELDVAELAHIVIAAVFSPGPAEKNIAG